MADLIPFLKREEPQDPWAKLSKSQALEMLADELATRGEDELLEFMRSIDPMWNAYEWDDEAEAFLKQKN